VVEQWAPEDTSTPIKPDSKAAPRAASRTLDEADRSLAAAGMWGSYQLIVHYLWTKYWQNSLDLLSQLTTTNLSCSACNHVMISNCPLLKLLYPHFWKFCCNSLGNALLQMCPFSAFSCLIQHYSINIQVICCYIFLIVHYWCANFMISLVFTLLFSITLTSYIC